MAFALDHAEAAQDVAEILTEALVLLETPVPMKVARLFLVSDILHNCGAPIKNASAYRGAFQEKLPYIFESLEETHRGLSSRITREAFKKRVMMVTAAWADWFLFADEFLKGLESTFTRGGLSTTPTLPAEEAETLRLEIDAMDPGECERTCRMRGLIADGGPVACAKRLINLETYTRVTS
jgi:U2-associated protein SR140